MMIDKITHKLPKDKMEVHDEGQYYETKNGICDGCNEVGPYMTECFCCGMYSIQSSGGGEVNYNKHVLTEEELLIFLTNVETNIWATSLELDTRHNICLDNVAQWGDALLRNNTLVDLTLYGIEEGVKETLIEITKDREPSLTITSRKAIPFFLNIVV